VARYLWTEPLCGVLLRTVGDPAAEQIGDATLGARRPGQRKGEGMIIKASE
jgi:hypothetical protein